MITILPGKIKIKPFNKIPLKRIYPSLECYLTVVDIVIVPTIMVNIQKILLILMNPCKSQRLSHFNMQLKR